MLPLVVILISNLIVVLCREPCNMNRLGQCHPLVESCRQSLENSTMGLCSCRPGYSYDSQGVCIKRTSNGKGAEDNDIKGSNQMSMTENSGGKGVSTAIWAVVVVLSLAALVGLFVAGTKYKLSQRLRFLRLRRYSTVFVSSANVDDDAPIT